MIRNCLFELILSRALFSISYKKNSPTEKITTYLKKSTQHNMKIRLYHVYILLVRTNILTIELEASQVGELTLITKPPEFKRNDITLTH